MKRFKKILCVIEPGKDNSAVIDQTTHLAEINQATLTVMSVIPSIVNYNGLLEDYTMANELEALALQTQQQTLEKLTESYRQRVKIDVEVSTGRASIEVIRKILRDDHDLVIKCPDATNGSGHAFSGEDKQLLRKCPCPVWMTRLQKGETYHRILAAVDVDDNHAPEILKTRQALNESVMTLAGSLAVSEFAELSIVSAWEATAESAIRFAPFIQRPQSEVDTYVEKARQHHADLLNAQLEQLNIELGQEAMNYIKPELHSPKGPARKNIPELAKELQADCIVMGTVGRVGIPGLIIGNTAESLLDQLTCSILAIKPKGFVTPVTLE
jgi:nucleotide-binding universal stress UspA family protein